MQRCTGIYLKIGRGRCAAPGPRAARQPPKPNSAPRRLRRGAGVRCTLLRSSCADARRLQC